MANATQTQRNGGAQAHEEYAGARLPTAIEEILSETRHGLSPENQYNMLKAQIAPGCTDEELAHFMYVCKSRGLDPFARQAYAIRRRTYDKEARQSVWKMTIQTAIDGFRLIAKRSGLEAQDEPEFEYSEAERSDLNPLGLVKCTVRVWKTGSARPTTTSAYWDEYRQTADDYQDGKKTGDKKLSGKWADMPRTMLAKVAEALTLRRAFPEELGGLYTTDEMDQATNASDKPEAPVSRPRPQPGMPNNVQRDLEESVVAALRAATSTTTLKDAIARMKAVENDLLPEQRLRVQNVSNEVRAKADAALRAKREAQQPQTPPPEDQGPPPDEYPEPGSEG